MKKAILLAAVAAMLVGMLAGPAAAHDGDAGVFLGSADVGKELTDGDCMRPTGGGLGVPVLSGPKNGYWALQTEVTGVLHGAGDLDACGRLSKVADNVSAIGAACGMSKGHSGTGTLTGSEGMTAIVVSLNDLGWKATAGGTLPVTGTYTGHGAGTVVAIVQAQGGQDCAGKITPDKDEGEGANTFTVAGVSALVPVTGIDDNQDAGTCKETGNPLCLYGDKKE